MSKEGAWIVSDNEEVWTCGEEFDTEEAAVAYAIAEYAEDYGVDPGRCVFVGQVSTEETNAAAIAEYAVDADGVVEACEERFYDLLGDAIEVTIQTTEEQRADLNKRLAAVVAAWLTEHSLVPQCFTMQKVTSHVVPKPDEDDADAVSEVSELVDVAVEVSE